MKDRSIRCALWLKKLGIGPNDIVVVCTHNHLDSYVPVLAAFFVDAIFTAWYYNPTIDAARRYLKTFKPKVIFACEKAADVLLEASALENMNVKLVVFGGHSKLTTLTDIMNGHTKEEIDNFRVVNVKSPRDVSLIILSSGSSGFPKGAMVPSKSILSHFLRVPICKDAPRFLWYSTLEWISCISLLLQAIMTYQTRIIPTRCEIEDAFHIIEKYKVNRLAFPPNLATLIARYKLIKKYDLKSVYEIFIGGSKCRKESFEAIRSYMPTAFIHHTYAMTEIGVIAASTAASKRVDSVGFVATNVQAKIVDLESGKSLGPNQHGEICAKASAFVTGYYNDFEGTKEACDEDGWYHTGDIGYYDENGEIFLVDRMKEMIKYRHHRISPSEIEEILLSHPEVQDAIVIGLPQEVDGEWPTAFCKKTTESKLTTDELMNLASTMEDYKKLRGGIHFIDNLLYTSCGKIARNEMKALAKKLIMKE